MSVPQLGIYRTEAVEYHARSRTDGELLMLLPGWTRWSYRLLVSLLLAAALFIIFGSVSQYAEGPAVIRAADRVPVTTAVAGIVEAVPAKSGDAVRTGDLLVSLRSEEERAQVASVEREFESALVRMLANPVDQAVRQTVAGLRAQRDLLAARLNERLVRAPTDGTVGDIRVRPGQSVTPGDVVVSLAGEPQRFSVVVLLPGRQRPELAQGQNLRLELAGYAYVYHDLRIDRIDDEVIGPQEVRRTLGPEIADSVTVTGPVVVVHASLSGTSFDAGGRTYSYHDGMAGLARARLRSERLLTTLLPGMRLVTERMQ